jgi:hypothetical protein
MHANIHSVRYTALRSLGSEPNLHVFYLHAHDGSIVEAWLSDRVLRDTYNLLEARLHDIEDQIADAEGHR